MRVFAKIKSAAVRGSDRKSDECGDLDTLLTSIFLILNAKRRMKRLHLIRLNVVIPILFLHYCMPFKPTVNIPAGIHNTDYRHNTLILIRNIKH